MYHVKWMVLDIRHYHSIWLVLQARYEENQAHTSCGRELVLYMRLCQQCYMFKLFKCIHPILQLHQVQHWCVLCGNSHRKIQHSPLPLCFIHIKYTVYIRPSTSNLFFKDSQNIVSLNTMHISVHYQADTCRWIQRKHCNFRFLDKMTLYVNALRLVDKKYSL